MLHYLVQSPVLHRLTVHLLPAVFWLLLLKIYLQRWEEQDEDQFFPGRNILNSFGLNTKQITALTQSAHKLTCLQHHFLMFLCNRKVKNKTRILKNIFFANVRSSVACRLHATQVNSYNGVSVANIFKYMRILEKMRTSLIQTM